jgi:hypothetical protein
MTRRGVAASGGAAAAHQTRGGGCYPKYVSKGRKSLCCPAQRRTREQVKRALGSEMVLQMKGLSAAWRGGSRWTYTSAFPPKTR